MFYLNKNKVFMSYYDNRCTNMVNVICRGVSRAAIALRKWIGYKITQLFNYCSGSHTRMATVAQQTFVATSERGATTASSLATRAILPIKKNERLIVCLKLIPHELFTIQPLVTLVHDYYKVSYLVEINHYRVPPSGNFIRDRYMGISKWVGRDFALLEARSKYNLVIEYMDKRVNFSKITGLTSVPLRLPSFEDTTSIAIGALDKNNVHLTGAHICLVKVLENDRFRYPLPAEEIDVDSLSYTRIETY